MPRGVYALTQPGGPAVREEFSCAPGPAGWRYVSRRSDGVGLDLTLRADGRPHRLEVQAGDAVLRGGAAGPALLWAGPAGRREVAAAGFTGDSPAFAVAGATLAGPAGGPLLLVLAGITLPSLAVLTVRQRWRRTARTEHPTDLGPLPVNTWQVEDADAGTQVTVHLAGDVVLAADGVELLDLDGPPTLTGGG